MNSVGTRNGFNPLAESLSPTSPGCSAVDLTPASRRCSTSIRSMAVQTDCGRCRVPSQLRHPGLQPRSPRVWERRHHRPRSGERGHQNRLTRARARSNPFNSGATTNHPARPTAGTKGFGQKNWGQKNDTPIQVVVLRHVSVLKFSVNLVFLNGAGFCLDIRAFFACRAKSKR